jgi:hypothetical protein
MKVTHRFAAAALTLAFGVGILGAPVAANASEEGRKNTAIGLGAAAAYLLLTQKDKVPGIIAGAGAAYAYKKYDDAKRDRQDRDRWYGRYDRYDRYDSRYDRNRDLYHDRYNDRYYRSDRYNDRYYDSRNRYDSRYDRRYDYRNDRDCEDDRYYSTRRRH